MFNLFICFFSFFKITKTETPTFQVEKFIPLLKKYITKTNPHVRQLLANWITALDAVPDIDMLVWLPTFLDGLFNMLSDVNRLIRNTADSALSDFLKELKLTTSVEFGPCTKSEVGKYNNNNTKKAK